MEILGLSTSPSSGGAYALILHDQNTGRRLPIIIGTFEAQAIALELERIKPPRPMSHDLMRNLIQGLDSFVRHICINELKDGTFYAQIVCEHDSSQKEFDARPSDAIALAVRFNAPIFVSSDVLNEAGIFSDDSDTVKAQPESIKTSVKSEKIETIEDKILSLEKKLQVAISEENYEKAARLRDELTKLRG